jgi:hypothetical protein
MIAPQFGVRQGLVQVLCVWARTGSRRGCVRTRCARAARLRLVAQYGQPGVRIPLRWRAPSQRVSGDLYRHAARGLLLATTNGAWRRESHDRVATHQHV